MLLRFQEDDEADRETAKKRTRALYFIAFFLILYLAVCGLGDWLAGQSLKSFAEAFGGLIVICCLGGLIYPVYHEFRIRTKEIDGKISAIESAIYESKERNTELLKRLTAIENRLDEIRDNR